MRQIDLLSRITATCVLMVIISALCVSLEAHERARNFTDYQRGSNDLKDYPPVDLELVPVSAYETGKMYIKIRPEISHILTADKIHATDKSIAGQQKSVIIGHPALDRLNSEYRVTAYKPVLYRLYDISGKSLERKNKHLEWGFDLWFEVELDQTTDIIAAVRAFQVLDDVAAAEPVYKKSIIEPVVIPYVDEDYSVSRWRPNDQRYSTQWALRNAGQSIMGVPGTAGADISAEAAWDLEKGLEQVIVAVFDQGIAFNHPDLQANMWEGIGPEGQNTNPGSHGTHVAGTISAVTNNTIGVAGIAGGSGNGDGVRLMSCPIFHPGAMSYSMQNIFAADNGAAISQNSWAYNEFDVYNQVDLNAINYFNANGGGDVLDGGITIFGSGNDNSNRNQYPAYYHGAVAVASTCNRDRKSDFSNYGSWIDISAPGSYIMSTVTGNSYNYESGTSMACPHISGVAALIISHAFRNNIILTGQQVKEIMNATADNIYPSNPNYLGQLGAGRVNAYAALIELQENYFGIEAPQILMAMAVNSSTINLQWIPNENENDVLIAASLSATIGAPETGTFYAVGHTLPGGGNIIYQGSDDYYNHTGLGAGRVYYYKAFSYDSMLNYSEGIATDAETPPDTATEPDLTVTPLQTMLRGNYPNPFNPETIIEFSIKEETDAMLHIYNLKGQLVKTLHKGLIIAGEQRIVWNGKDEQGREVGSGIYFYRLTTDHYEQVNRMLLVK